MVPQVTNLHSDKKKNQWCNICKNKSHNTNRCRKKNRDNVYKIRDDDHHFAFKINDEDVKIEGSAHTFLVDCGATTHIVNDKSCFIDTDPTFKSSDHYIELADGTTVNGIAKEKGTIMTQFRTSDNLFVDVKLRDVLYIPDFFR